MVGQEINGQKVNKIVAIGASAGGLDAIERFFRYLPVDTGMTFVLIQHLSPDFKSVMDELLSRYSQMPVHVVEDMSVMEANSIYLIPPGKEMTLVDNMLRLRDKVFESGLNFPINIFFSSLVPEVAADTIAIILSGTGSDGAKGMSHIKRNGGKALVQSPDSAKFDGMPKSALSTGLVDYVGSPEKLVEYLLKEIHYPVEQLSCKPYITPENVAGRMSYYDGEVPQEFIPVYEKLMLKTGIDFNLYKPNTILRRIMRRMDFAKTDKPDAYVDLLSADSRELDALARDVLIEVTSFFRDENAFDFLKERIVPELLESHENNEDIRIWVAGCATGEEVYSIAMILDEVASKSLYFPPIKIFATDIHKSSLEFASQGVYSSDAMANMSAERLQKYFEATEEGYAISPTIRKMVVFAEHNLLRDPPFMRTALISCRNLLIYFKSAAQEIAIQKFMFSLKKNGYLFLGSSESLGRFSVEFKTVDRHLKVYQKLMDSTSVAAYPIFFPSNATSPRRDPLFSRTHLASRTKSNRICEQIVEKIMPSAFLVSKEGELLHVFGDAWRYLKQEGQVSTNLFDLLRGSMRLAASTVMYRAIKERRSVKHSGLKLDDDPLSQPMALTAEPVEADGGLYVLIVLQEEQKTEPSLQEGQCYVDLDETARLRIVALEDELKLERENLQTVVEELTASNEELQATNEEMIASNEELQSTNEELQSVNEELYTVNAEYERKNQELITLNFDLNNLMQSSNIGTLFLDKELCVRKFTPAVSHAFRLKPQDIGRPIYDITQLIDNPGLIEDINIVIATGVSTEKEVLNVNKLWLLQRIYPYRVGKGEIDGAVLTYVDISALKNAEEQIKASGGFLNAVLNSLSAHIAVLDQYGTIIATNEAWRRFGEENQGNACTLDIGANYFGISIIVSDDCSYEDAQKAIAGIKSVISGKEASFEMEYPCHSPQEQRWFLMHVTLCDVNGATGAVVAHLNITKLKFLQKELGMSKGQLQNMAAAMAHTTDAIVILDEVGAFIYANPAFQQCFGIHKTIRTCDELLKKCIVVGINKKTEHLEQIAFESFKDQHKIFNVNLVPILEGALPTKFIVTIKDVTNQTKIEEHMQHVQKMEAIGQLAGGIAHDFNNILQVIGGTVELVFSSADNHVSELQGKLNPVIDSVEKARRLIAQLLTFSRKGLSQSVQVDLNKLIASMMDMVSRLLGAHIEIKFLPDKALKYIYGDPTQIEQIVLNLCLNARDAMPDGGLIVIRTSQGRFSPTLCIGGSQAEREGESVILNISDSGVGMSKDTIQHIFEPFYTTKEVGKGTGIGLATVYGIVRQHKADICVESEPGYGTDFCIYFPSSDEPIAKPEAKRAEPPEMCPCCKDDDSQKTVLIAEDDEGLLDMVGDMLEGAGFCVIRAHDGEEAVNLFKKFPDEIDILVFDVAMPNKSGTAAWEEIHAIRPEIQVIFTTGYSFEAMQRGHMPEQSLCVIQKPYKFSVLIEKMRELLENSISMEGYDD